MIATPTGNVSYRQEGSGPDIVLLHSLLADQNVFERIVPELSRSRRVTLVDLPGYGTTDLVEPGIFNYADLVGGLLDSLGLDPASTAVMGNGFGGFVALATAVRYGSRFDRLVVAGAGAGFPADATQAFHTMARNVRGTGIEAILDIAVRRIFTEDYLAEHPDDDEARRRALRTADPEGFVRACQTLIELDLRAEVADVANPTLIVVGSDDAATPPAMAQDLAERMPNARLEVLQGLAHAPQLQDPGAFLATVLPFLDAP